MRWMKYIGWRRRRWGDGRTRVRTAPEGRGLYLLSRGLPRWSGVRPVGPRAPSRYGPFPWSGGRTVGRDVPVGPGPSPDQPRYDDFHDPPARRLSRRQRSLRRPAVPGSRSSAGGGRPPRYAVSRLRGAAPGRGFRRFSGGGGISPAEGRSGSPLRHGDRRPAGALSPGPGRPAGRPPALAGPHPLGTGAAPHAEGDAARPGADRPHPPLRHGALPATVRGKVLHPSSPSGDGAVLLRRLRPLLPRLRTSSPGSTRTCCAPWSGIWPPGPRLWRGSRSGGEARTGSSLSRSWPGPARPWTWRSAGPCGCSRRGGTIP